VDDIGVDWVFKYAVGLDDKVGDLGFFLLMGTGVFFFVGVEVGEGFELRLLGLGGRELGATGTEGWCAVGAVDLLGMWLVGLGD
jgi:hypothetical protein